MFVCVLSLLLVAHVKFTSTVIQNTYQRPCSLELTVDLTNGVRKNDGTIVKDNISYTKENYFFHNDTRLGCVCNIQPCIRKCCGPNKKMYTNKTCQNTDISFSYDIYKGTNGISFQNSTAFYLIYSEYCENDRVLLFPNVTGEEFYLQPNGTLFAPAVDETRPLLKPDEYCLENFLIDGEEFFSALVCSPSEQDDFSTYVGMIISMPFLLLTFIAYALLPDRNLHMKALMIYVINLLMGYLLLVIIQLSDTKFAYTSCALMGYFCLFFFMVSFFWMNVICIDIWFTFSGLRGFSGSKKSAERKRFFMYCGYGFGVPTIQVIIVYLIQANASQNSQLSPGIADGQCFLRRGIPELLYFYGPMAILITTNIVFFAITAVKIRNIKKDTSMLKKEDSKRHSYENDKQTFNLYLKLLFAMGVNWSMEIISWAVIWKVENAPEYIWYLTDFCNAIYGVFIFFIFVFKRSTWRLLKKRYYSFIGKPHLAHSLTMTNTTRVTSYSTNNSSVHENPRGGANETRTLTSEA